MDFLLNTSVGQILQILPFSLITTFAIWNMIAKKKIAAQMSGRKVTVAFLSIFYYIMLLFLTLFPQDILAAFWVKLLNRDAISIKVDFGVGEYNFTPTIIRYITGEYVGSAWVWKMIVGNIIMYLPFGFFPLVSRKHGYRRAILLGCATSFVIEIVQPYLGRSFDVNDIFCNILGVVIGTLLFKAVDMLFPGSTKKYKIYDVK